MKALQKQPRPILAAAPPKEERRPYTQPAILYEGELEVRAGSPLSIPDPLDPLGLEPKE